MREIASHIGPQYILMSMKEFNKAVYYGLLEFDFGFRFYTNGFGMS